MSNPTINKTKEIKDNYSNITEIGRRRDSINQNTTQNPTLYLSIGLILVDLIKENTTKSSFKEKLRLQKNNIFTSHGVPNITLSKYLERMKKYMKLEDNSIILGLIYLDRFCRKTKIILTDYNTHRLLFISILTAVKYQEDKFYTNKLYAQVCGVKTTVLNQMEYEFVIGMGFEFYVSVSLFDKYKNTISTE